jgi:acyl dehydratase
MTLATLPHLRESLLRFTSGEVMFYGYNRVRFPAPVPVGARIRMRAVVAAVDPIELGEQLTLDIRVEIEDQARPACVGQAIWRHYDLEANS